MASMARHHNARETQRVLEKATRTRSHRHPPITSHALALTLACCPTTHPMRHERFLQVDKKQVNTMNLQVLQRMDPEIEEVLRAVSHVALYQLDVKKMEWVRAGCTPAPSLTCAQAPCVTRPSVQRSVRTDGPWQLRWRGLGFLVGSLRTHRCASPG